jgi:putative hydrolase of the HAD superfamily
VVGWLSEARALAIPVGIASSSPIEWVEEHLNALGLSDFFSCIVCCDDHVPAKPLPVSYRLACERLKADPLKSVAVEDSPHGVAAAVEAGFFTVAVPHELTAGLDLTAAHVVATSLEDLTLSSALTRASTRRR